MHLFIWSKETIYIIISVRSCSVCLFVRHVFFHISKESLCLSVCPSRFWFFWKWDRIDYVYASREGGWAERGPEGSNPRVFRIIKACLFTLDFATLFKMLSPYCSVLTQRRGNRAWFRNFRPWVLIISKLSHLKCKTAPWHNSNIGIWKNLGCNT